MRYKVKPSGNGYVILRLTDSFYGLAWSPVRKTRTEAEAWAYVKQQKEREKK